MRELSMLPGSDWFIGTPSPMRLAIRAKRYWFFCPCGRND
jgi:hypothetical protein